MSENLEKLTSELNRLLVERARLDVEIETLRQKIFAEQGSECQTPPLRKTQKNPEKFLIQNFIGKIGIAVLVIGLIVLFKYLFDKGLLSTVAKISLGYIMSAVAVFFARRNWPERKTLASVLFSGGVAFAYALTFVACHYFNFFTDFQALVIASAVALLAFGTGLFYGDALFAASLFMVFFAPVFAGHFVDSQNFTYWTIFVLCLDAVSFVVCAVKKKVFALNVAYIMTLLFMLSAFFDAPDNCRNFWFGFTFFLIFFAADVFCQIKKIAVQNIFLTLANALFSAVFLTAAAGSPQTAAVYVSGIAACFFVSAAFLKDGFKKLHLAVLTLNYAVCLLLFDNKNLQFTVAILVAEALLFFAVFKKTQNPFFEKFSFNLLILSVSALPTVLPFYFVENYKPVVNSAFFSLLFAAAAQFSLTKKFSVKTFSDFAYMFVCLTVLCAAELETAFYVKTSRQLFLSLLAAVYALGVFVLGVKTNVKTLRYFAVALAFATALKIVFCDAWDKSLALKAVIFITEGGIFLLISYIYSKFFKD